MAVNPLTLFHGVVPNLSGTVYTVPGGLTVVVRHVLVVGAGGAANVTVDLAGQPIFGTEPVAANRRLEQWLMAVLDPGDTITALSSVAGNLRMLVTGFSL